MVSSTVKNLILYSAGHTYSNLSRLFLRLFTGVMFLQFGLRQIMHFDVIALVFPGLCGMTPVVSISVVTAIELVCATCIILGLMMRIALIPSLVLMVCITVMLMGHGADPASQVFIFKPGYPVMFCGIFIYMLLAGPGKISVDYVIATLLLDRSKEDDEVLDKA